MLTKSLLVAEAVLLAAETIKESSDAEWPQIEEHLKELLAVLEREPNPDFTAPLMAALNVGFNSKAEPILSGILANFGFDYRFITGRPKRFSALKPGKTIDPQVQRLWQKARDAGRRLNL